MELLTVQDAAERAGVTVKAIYYSLGHGKLTRHKQYGKILVDLDELAKYRPRGHGGVTRSPAADTHRLFAEGMRHVWDTPEEDAAWAHLQEGT
jgi:hypothetical protein